MRPQWLVLYSDWAANDNLQEIYILECVLPDQLHDHFLSHVVIVCVLFVVGIDEELEADLPVIVVLDGVADVFREMLNFDTEERSVGSHKKSAISSHEDGRKKSEDIDGRENMEEFLLDEEPWRKVIEVYWMLVDALAENSQLFLSGKAGCGVDLDPRLWNMIDESVTNKAGE